MNSPPARASAVIAVIPARFGSTRLPGKPLSDILGKPMIQRVHERVRRVRGLDRVLVATDDERIAEVVRGFGGEAAMTSPSHATGTDRLAEVARGSDARIVVNVQGDEPLLDPDAIEAALAPMLADPSLEMATLSVPITDVEEMLSPSAVKVVTDGGGDALYFSRSPIPWALGVSAGEVRKAAQSAVRAGLARKHIGVYVYLRETLLRLAALPPAPLEEAEGLEQLRALHHGVRIRVVHREAAGGPAVDTPEDLERVRALVRSAG